MKDRIKTHDREYRQLRSDKIERENRAKKLKKQQIQKVENVIESLMECSPYDEKETDWMIGFFQGKLKYLITH